MRREKDGLIFQRIHIKDHSRHIEFVFQCRGQLVGDRFCVASKTRTSDENVGVIGATIAPITPTSPVAPLQSCTMGGFKAFYRASDFFSQGHF